MDREAVLLHQVHPAKLVTAATADVVSTALFWQRRVPAALVAGFVPRVIASTMLLRGDLTSLRGTRRGRYVLTHMPAWAQAVRLAGPAARLDRCIPQERHRCDSGTRRHRPRLVQRHLATRPLKIYHRRP